MAAAKERLSIHVPVAMDTHAILEILWEKLFFDGGPCRGAIRRTTGALRMRAPMWRPGRIPPP
jgi:hypothetical protein